MPANHPISILFVTANPDGTESLATDVEARRIDEALWNSLNRERFAVHKLGAARIGDLAVYLRRHRPRILHIALHGTADGLLFNDPEDWQEQTLAGEELAAIVATYQAEAKEKLGLVVLAGCGTENSARLLCAHTGCAIGTSDDISDRAVLHFSPAFYAALGDERTVGNAFDNAVAEVQAHGQQSDAALLRLLTRPGIDPHSLRLDTPTRRPLSDAHLDYLRRWFGKGWATVNLADISQRQERASLLDVYVPLPVDFTLDIEVKDHQIVDWWVHREAGAELNAEAQGRRGAIRRGGLQPPDAPDDDTDGAHEIEPAKERVWADLGVGETALQTIVDGIQAKIDERKNDEPTLRWNRNLTESWPLEAEHAACVQPRFVLLGEPGGGKSSFLRHLALCLAGEMRRRAGQTDMPANASLESLGVDLPDVYTPIYIELRALVASHFPPLSPVEGPSIRLPDVDDFWRYVQEELGAGLAGFETELRTLFADNEAILLLDGLDEIPQAGDKRRRDQVKAFIASLLRSYPSLRVIVTSRPHAYRRGEWALDGFGRAELEHLDWARLDKLAHSLFAAMNGNTNGDEAKAFVQAIRDDPHIEPGLHRNPLFFTLLAALYLASDPNDRRLPATRADLYRQSTDLLLGRWTQRRGTGPLVDNPPEHLRPVLESLACTITEQSETGQDTTLFDAGLLDQILRRARLRILPLDVSDYLSQHAGILVEQAPEEFAFVHRSFQEHLAACELTHQISQPRIPPIPEERRFPAGLLQRVLDRPDLWENVAGLAADELLAQKRQDELVRLLVDMARPYDRERTAPQTALLALSIANRLKLLDDELEEFDRRQLLCRVALTALSDIERFDPEQRLIAGQLLGARPGLDPRPGVGLQANRLPDIAWVKIPKVDEKSQSEFIYQEGKRDSPDDFWMARYPITYAQFQTFKDADDGWCNSHWWDGLALNDQDKPGDQAFPFWNHSRERVSWYQAIAFCRWLTEQARQHPELLPAEAQDRADWRITLPTEWQWEKAARGHDGRQYPWGGDSYQRGYANINETRENAGPHNLQTTSAVGMYPQGGTPSGLLDLSGNVWEWCLNEYETPGNFQENGSEGRVVRGGSWYDFHYHASAVSRGWYSPYSRDNGNGFRVVWSASVPVTSAL